MSEPTININLMLGYVKLETKLVPSGRDIVGEGRKWVYDGNGNLVEDSGWQPTGVRLVAPPESPERPWWKLW